MAKTNRRDRIDSELVQLARENARIELEDRFQEDRHRFIGSRASVRLLMGAFAAGYIAPDKYGNALAKLTALDGIDFDLETHLAEVPLFARQAAPDPGKYRRSWSFISSKNQPNKILVIDDHVQDAGWSIVFDAIFSGHVMVAKSRESALSIAEGHHRDIALVLLDLEVPQRNDGLQILKCLKEKFADLPVVMFSATDEILVARKCFRLGASGYYVKELGSSDRRSEAYFEKFLEVVQDALADPMQRRLWQSISDIPKPHRDSLAAELYGALIAHLRRAYFFLTFDLDDPRLCLWLADNVRDRSRVWAHSINECGCVVEALVYYLADESCHVDRIKDRKARGDSFVLIDQDSVFNSLYYVRDNGYLDANDLNRAKEVWNRRHPASHAVNLDQRNESLDELFYTKQQVQQTLRYAGSVAENVIRLILERERRA